MEYHPLISDADQQDVFDVMGDIFGLMMARHFNLKLRFNVMICMLASDIRLNFPATQHESLCAEIGRAIKSTIDYNGAWNEEERAAAQDRAKAGMVRTN